MSIYKPVVLVILDGWGISDEPSNVLKTTELPMIEHISEHYPLIALQASGISVGLPWGEAGNSEVGHMTMGIGKILYQNLPRISLSIQNGTFYKNKVLTEACTYAKENDKALHLMGLVSTGAVHAHRDHLYALLELAKRHGITNVFVHVFTDGRDSSPKSGKKAIKELEEKMKEIGVGAVASVIGRNWAMDRNNNWDRTEQAYNLIRHGVGKEVYHAEDHMERCYVQDTFDEFIGPGVVLEQEDTPIGCVNDEDAIIFFNFREDRARQLTKAFTEKDFDGFNRPTAHQGPFVTMTEYAKDLPVSVAFPEDTVMTGLGQILAEHGKKQLRISETEKYAHVTYFFNGGKEKPHDGEDRTIVPSKPVDRFDEKPEMQAAAITEKTIAAIREQKYDFILMNYANADMVAHTGNEVAAVEAVKTIDESLSALIPAVLEAGGCLLITADHGNVEVMRDYRTGEVDTEHNTSPVPLWYITPDNERKKTPDEVLRAQSEIGGLLSDLAPTILAIMDLPKPDDMHGENLLGTLE